jgi:hypothetical protein
MRATVYRLTAPSPQWLGASLPPMFLHPQSLRGSSVRFLILLVVFSLVGWTMARSIRDRARQSPVLRARLLIRGCIALVLGLVAALWLPGHVPQTQGPPATIVILLLLWMIGGGLAFVGVTTIVGALLARPPAGDPPTPPVL